MSDRETQDTLIDFTRGSTSAVERMFKRGMQSILNPLFRIRATNAIYRNFLEQRADSEGSFFDCGLDCLGVGYDVSEEDLERIPKEGPVILLANHPFGGVDGLILGSLLDRIREDGRLLVNYLLDRIDHMGGRCFYVDPFGGTTAKQRNLAGIKGCLKWLKEGGAIGTFPAGTVSHLHPRKRQVTDPAWVDNIAALVRKSRATVVPVYFTGRNSNFFQMAGLVHPRLRTGLLPREMLRLRDERIAVRIGTPIQYRRIQSFATDRELVEFLRLRCYILGSREISEKTSFKWINRSARTGKQVIEAQSPEALEAELADLPESALVAEQGDFSVYCARAGEIPRTLLELGRLRELTFRAVGEGTGESKDLDRFDSFYRHIFMWNHKEREIVGAYRMGLTDEILPTEGKGGIYTTTLFRFKAGVLPSLSPAIELGRSFVVEAYQRKPVSLSLIWRGIGTFIARNPRYCTLFGPVSISKEYRSLSKNMMVAYLKEHSLDPELASKVRAKRPPRSRFFGVMDRQSFQRSVRDIDDVSALISEIEREIKGVPVLLRQYLKLNATVLSFNVDPAFNDCIDGLLLVDLRRTQLRTLEKYMGAEGASAFLAYHRSEMEKSRESNLAEISRLKGE